MVNPGHYDIGFDTLRSGLYVKSIQWGQADALDGLKIEGAEPVTLEIVLSKETGEVKGLAADKDDQLAAGATVILLPELKHWSRTDRFYAVTTDQYGGSSKGSGTG